MMQIIAVQHHRLNLHSMIPHQMRMIMDHPLVNLLIQKVNLKLLLKTIIIRRKTSPLVIKTKIFNKINNPLSKIVQLI